MPINVEKLKQKRARTGAGWQPKNGLNSIRVFPHTTKYFTEDLDDFAYSFRSHFLKVPGEDYVVTRCYKDKREPCIVCHAHSVSKDTNDPAFKKIVEDIFASSRRLLNIFDLTNPQAGIQPYECGPKVYNFIYEYVVNPRWGDVLNPEAGHNFDLTLTPKGQSKSGFNEYGVQPDPQKTSVIGMLPPNWREQMDALEAQIAPYVPVDDLKLTLDKMGISYVGFGGQFTGASTNGATTPAPVSAQSAPQPVPGSAPVPVQAPAPVQAPTPTPVQPAQAPTPVQPVEPQPSETLPAAAPTPAPTPAPAAAPTPVPTQVAEAPGAMAAATTVDNKVYPPGLQLHVLPEYGRVPVCFKDFEPDNHPCTDCPDMDSCQLATLGM